MTPDTTKAAEWAQRLEDDPWGGWDAIRAEAVAADPARLGAVAATLRWTVEVECHHKPAVQAATLARIADGIEGRDPELPTLVETGTGRASELAALLDQRAALERRLAALLACLPTSGDTP